MVGAYRNDKGAVDVISMYVAPEARGRGIGRSLLEALIKDLEAAGISEIHLDVTTAQTAAIALYRACGFGVQGEEESTHPDGSRHTLLNMRRSAIL